MTDESYTRFVQPVLGRFLELCGRADHFTSAKGIHLTTNDGRVFADWYSGFGSFNLGHNPPEILRALSEHLEKSAPNLYHDLINPYAGQLGLRLIQAAGPDYGHVFFSNSGTEAVEAALKLAMRATKRRNVIYLAGGYHGTTLGSLSLMANGVYRDGFEPLLAGFHAVPFGDIDVLNEKICETKPAAFVLEPVQMESGARAVGHEYFAKACALCRQHGTLMILDEVQTGMGRTGRLFAFQDLHDSPDIFVLAKSLGGGLMPIGACVSKEGIFVKAYGDFASAEIHNSTFGGNALACVAALKALELTDEALLQGVRETGNFLAAELQSRLGAHPLVKGICLYGLLGGISFHDVTHPWLTWESLGVEEFLGQPVTAALVSHKMHRRGFLTQICGHDWGTLRIEPPLTVTAKECAAFVSALTEVLGEIHDAIQ